MQLSENNRQVFLMAAHQVVEEQAAAYANDLLYGRSKELDYPPNAGFPAPEEDALKLLQANPALHTVLRKVLAGCAAGTVFDLLNLMAGPSDPKPGKWSGVRLADTPEETQEHREFPHDVFFDACGRWREIRRNKNWRLDLLSE